MVLLGGMNPPLRKSVVSSVVVKFVGSRPQFAQIVGVATYGCELEKVTPSFEELMELQPERASLQVRVRSTGRSRVYGAPLSIRIDPEDGSVRSMFMVQVLE